MKQRRARAASPDGESREDLGLVDALAQLSFAVQDILVELAAEQDVSIVQTRLLGVLRDRSLGMNQLARYLDLDKSSITGLVDRAERRRLVRRKPSTTDARGIDVSITALGRNLAQRVEAEFARRIDALLEPLATAERKTLSALASRVLIESARAQGVDLLGADSSGDSAPAGVARKR